MYKDSKWSGKDPGGFSYILGHFAKFDFLPIYGIAVLGGKSDRGVKNRQLDTMVTGKLLLVSGGQNSLFAPSRTFLVLYSII